MQPFSQPPSLWNERLEFVQDVLRRNVRIVIATAIAVCVSAVGLFSLTGRSARSVDESLPKVSQVATSLFESSEVVVYVTGAVTRPGVLRLHPGSRVVDALERAGSTTADADLAQLNLAAKLVDGQRIYVPKKGETLLPEVSGGSVSDPANSVVNLNSATAEQLDGLPGVGPSTAAAILAYRTQHGSFRSVEDLKNVDGIGDAKFEKLKPLVTV